MAIHVGIAVYQPDCAALIRLVQSQADYPVWLFLNSPLTPEARSRLPSSTRILNDGQNLGLGTAYNRIADAARQEDATMLLLLDQDATASPDMATRLNETYAMLHWELERPAVVGALPIAPNEAHKPPRVFRDRMVQTHGTAWPTEFVISSGSLFDLTILYRVGDFREDFFIDAIDIEWCFRAQSLGYTCWIDSAILMPHRLGQGIIQVPVLNMRLAKQVPSRLYTYVRNQTAMLRLSHVPSHWKLRILPYMLAQSVIYTAVSQGQRRTVLRALWSGFVDGVRLRMGPGRRDSL